MFKLPVVYVKVYENRLVLRRLGPEGKSATIVPEEAFSTNGLLVGQFDAAEKALRNGLVAVSSSKWFTPRPIVIIQPMEKIEDGLSEVKKRSLHDIAAQAGATKVFVYVGSELSDDKAEEYVK